MPSREWGQIDTPRFRLVDYLSRKQLSSADMLACNDLLARSIFGQKKSKHPKRTWTVQNMMVDYVSNPTTENDILQEFERVKPNLNRCFEEDLDIDVILQIAKELSVKILQKHMMILTEGIRSAVEW